MSTSDVTQTTDPVALLRSQFASPVNIMGGESYVLDLDAVRKVLDEVERLRKDKASLEAELQGFYDREFADGVSP